MEEYRYVYLCAVLGAFLLWVIMFVWRPKFRKEMFLMSALVSALGVTQALYVQEYWTPVYVFPVPHLGFGLEDIFLAAFLYGGLGSVLYRGIANERYICPPSIPLSKSLLECFAAFAAGLLVFFFSEFALELNIIYTTSLGLLAAGVALAVFNPQSLKTMLANGLLFGILALIGLGILDAVFPGYIAYTWNLEALSGVLIQGVPIEEFFFHFSVGFSFAIAYECLYHCRVLTRPRG